MKSLHEIDREEAEQRESDLMRAKLTDWEAVEYALREEALSNPIVADKLEALRRSRELGDMSTTRPTTNGTLCSIVAALCRASREQSEKIQELQRQNQILRQAAGIGTNGYRLKKEVAKKMLDKEDQ